jgi:hypothetical protein
MKTYKDMPWHRPKIHTEELSVRNWRSLYRAKIGPNLAFHGRKFTEEWIEGLLLNTLKEARAGNIDDV